MEKGIRGILDLPSLSLRARGSRRVVRMIQLANGKRQQRLREDAHDKAAERRTCDVPSNYSANFLSRGDLYRAISPGCSANWSE